MAAQRHASGDAAIGPLAVTYFLSIDMSDTVMSLQTLESTRFVAFRPATTK
jgi:hypothetical protein